MASRLERTARGGAGFFLANLLSRGFGLLFVVLATRVLGPYQYGLLALGLSVFEVAQNIAAFGLPNTIQRFLSGSGEQNVSSIYGAIAVLGVIATIAGSAAMYAAAPWLAFTIFEEANLVVPLRVLAVGMMASIPFRLGRAVLQAQERIRATIVLNTVTSAAKLCLGGLILFIMQTAVGAAWAISLSFVVAAAVALGYLRSLPVQPHFKEFRAYTGRVLRYSIPLVLVGFGYLVAQQADRLMLGALADTASVGVYSVISSLALMMGLLHSSFVSIFMPIASEAYRAGAIEEVRTSYLFMSRWIGLVNALALIVFAGFGSWILHVFGPGYATTEAYTTLLILTTLYFLGTWIGPTGALLQMSDRQGAELTNTVFFIVVNIVLNYLLIPSYGMLGAACATFASGLLRNVLQIVEIIYWHRLVPATWQTAGTLCITLAGLALIVQVAPGVPRAATSVMITIGLGLYGYFTVTDREKTLIKESVLKRFAAFWSKQ